MVFDLSDLNNISAGVGKLQRKRDVQAEEEYQ
jgi:hypothetical protein